MDGIQPLHGATPRPAGLRPARPFTPTHDPTPVKTPSDYLRALRRRVWLVLAIGVPLSVARGGPRRPAAGRLPRAGRRSRSSRRSTTRSSRRWSRTTSARADAEPLEKYVPNRIALLKSKALAEQVVNDPDIVQAGAPAGEEAAEELLDNLQTRQIHGTRTRSPVTLEGTDPARTAKLLETLL